MALINQNSIIGVTSITSPSSSNVLTVHANDTTERLRISETGLSFSGTNSSLDTSGNATFNGNVSIGGILTYEDVTNIDSVGIITARNAIVISEDNAIHFRGTAADDNDAILRESAGGGQLLINSRNDAIINIDSNNDSTDAHFAVAHGAATGSSTELFRVQENGNTGIGTNNPGSNKLQIQGSSAFYGNGGASATWGDTSYLGALSFDGSAQPVIRAASSKSLIFQVNQSTEALRIESNGYVKTNSEFWVGGASPVLRWRNSSSEYATARISSNDLYFEVANAERLRITSGGNITYGNQSTSTANNSSALVHISAGKEYWSGTAGDYRALKHRIYDNTIDDMYGIGVSASLLEIQSQTDMAFFAGGVGSGTGRRHERMRIEGNTGNVSIGTASPGGFRLKVQVADSSSYQSALNLTNNVNADFQIELKSSETRFGPSTNTPLAIKNGAGEKLRITSAGDLGIGTNSPTTGNPTGAKFIHIHNSDGSTNANSPSEIYFTNANSGSSGGSGGLITFYDTGFYFWNYQNDDLHFGTGGNEKFKFDHSLNTLDFVSTSKIRLKGASATGTTHAHLNFGSQGAANTDTRAIDIWGSWGDQESKTITWNHGSTTSNMVCQQRVRYNASPSATYYEIGRFYHGQDTTAFPVRFKSTSTTTANLELDGNLVVPSGNGIDFSATANGTTSSSELFDDYEEGAWTPSITLGGGSSGMTYSRQEGHYTKIGRQVFAQFRITLTAKGSSSGQLRINGLPFTAADTFSSTGIDGQVHIAHDNGFNAGNVGGGAVAGYVEGATTYFLLTTRDTNANVNTMTNAFIDNDLSISGTVIFYA